LKSGCTEEATQQSSVFHQYMRDVAVEFRRDDMVVSTDRNRIDPAAVLTLLHSTFWAQGMTRDVLARAIANSVSFGLFDHSLLVGFGRAVTDLATYAYWTDVVIAPSHRGRGLGQWLSECMLAHPDLQGLRRVALLTRDAAPLYTRVGFTTGSGELVYMERRP
jgi:GNAT superfamily N-acetyltransferase